MKPLTAALLALMLAGCGERQEIITDARGCKWTAWVHPERGYMIQVEPLVDSTGQPMCGEVK